MKPAPAFAVIIESETMDRETGDADFEAFLARMFDENILADALVAQSSRVSGPCVRGTRFTRRCRI